MATWTWVLAAFGAAALLAGVATVIALMPTRALGQPVPAVSRDLVESNSWDPRLATQGLRRSAIA